MEAVPMPALEPGKLYFFVVCKDCLNPFAFCGAPAPENTHGPVRVQYDAVMLHCSRCEADNIYDPKEFLIHQAPSTQ
jgi:hypothetical protein